MKTAFKPLSRPTCRFSGEMGLSEVLLYPANHTNLNPPPRIPFSELISMHGEWKPPEWWYRKQRPTTDDAYLENLTRVIFQAGLNWHVIDKKWSTTKKAFEQFSISKVAGFTDHDVQRLLKDQGIVKNKSKVCATIQNAAEFQAIKKQHGSFQKWLDSLDKSNNYAAIVKELTKRFKHLGPSSASLFLYTVGERIEPWDMPH
jgi:3-methyladenine DNA glycosylase Tag